MKEKIKQAIIEQLKINSNYTFSELIFELEKLELPVNGTRALYIKENLIIWENTSSDFNNAIAELQQEDKIILKPLNRTDALLVYSCGGVLLKLPIADKIRKYSEPHWFPTIIKAK